MIMMAKDTDKKHLKGRLLMLIPLSVIFFSATGFINGLFPEKDIIESYYVPGYQEPAPAITRNVSSQDTGRKKTVVVIRSDRKEKEVDKDAEIKVTGYVSQEKNDSLIIVVDGTQVKNISSVNPDSIESVNVMKDDNLIVIRTKKPEKRSVIKVTEGSGIETSGKILFVIDGKETTDETILKTIDPGDIESIQVLKGEDNLQSHGKSGLEGIIIVRTKKQ
jgi:hypothetical protein